MAAVLVAFLELQHWDVYQEVRIHPDYSTSPIADIVAVKHIPEYDQEIVWIIETKTSLNFTVCEQAMQRRPHCHMVSVAVPRKHSVNPNGWTKKKQPSAGYRFALAALKKFNIGLLFVSDPTVPGIEKPVEQPYEPTFIVDAHHAAATYKLREWLKPEHKTMAKAGTSGAGIVTPFRLTALRLTQIVRDTGGWMLLRDALVLAKSHYKSINGGTASMADMIAKGIVTGLEIKRDGRRVFVRAT